MYLLAHADDVISDLKPIVQTRGKFSTDTAAASLMSKKSNWIEFNLTGDSQVLPELQMAKAHDIPSVPTTLNAFLGKLEVLGFAAVKLRMHSIKRLALSWGKHTSLTSLTSSM